MNYFIPKLKDRIYILDSIDSNNRDPISNLFIINNKATLYSSTIQLTEQDTFTIEANLDIDLTKPIYIVVEDLNGRFFLINKEFIASPQLSRTLNNRKVTFTIYANYYPVECKLTYIDSTKCQYDYETITSIEINNEESLDYLDAAFTLTNESFTLQITLEDYPNIQYDSVKVTLNTGEQFILHNLYDSITRSDNLITLTLVTYDI